MMNDMTGRPPHRRIRWAWRRSRAALCRPALFGLGWVLFGIGILGLFLPVLPGTVFLILSAACFTRSSPRFEAWLLSHPRVGPAIRQWRQRGAIPRRAKWIACLSLAVSGLILLASAAPGIARGLSLLTVCAVAIYIVTRPDP